MYYSEISKISKCLILGAVMCIYILSESVFPNLRVPFTFLDPIKTEKFNEIVKELSIGYLSGLIVYYLTVVLRNYRKREKRLWEIYDLIQKLNDVVVDVEKEENIRIEELSYELFCKYIESGKYKNFVDLLKRTLDKLRLYDDVLTEKESRIIGNIRFVLSMEIDGSESDKIRKLIFENLKSLCKGIANLNNGIIREVRSE